MKRNIEFKFFIKKNLFFLLYILQFTKKKKKFFFRLKLKNKYNNSINSNNSKIK